jgi:SpoVK/Ycf46/Vps4 family AAA+-type ATPase
LRQFGVAARRGVLLQGSPGNGKTMACRWLRARCRRHGFSWKSITPDELDAAREKHAVTALLQPESPGLVLLDDFDILLRQRSEEGHTPQQTALLAALDGVAAKTPAVYLFASNLRIDEINPAVRRPGRIDIILQFDAPDSALRRRLIVERWPSELVAAIDVERAVADSAGWSFAELEEARKLLVLNFAETGQWSWAQAGAAMRQRRDACAPKRPIGFGAIATVNNEDTPCVVAKSRF